MKKFAAFVAVVVLAAFAAPALAATNPFMDVPMNHWAYDAIGQLAAHGILSGYPDGTYKGKQPTTRYEMASALARALAVVDMTKASKQDVEMMRKLLIEFKDELDALGVQVDEIDAKVSKLDERLGGWRISGRLRLDIVHDNAPEAPNPDGQVRLQNARVKFERWFGEDDQIHFVGELEGRDDGGSRPAGWFMWHEFYAEMPFFADTKLTVGRWDQNWEDGYSYATKITGGYDQGGFYTDHMVDGIMLSKQFGLGVVKGYVSHTGPISNINDVDNAAGRAANVTDNDFLDAWEIHLKAEMQFTEQFGFDIGGQVFYGDNSEPAAAGLQTGDLSFNDMYSIYAMLRFNFNENIGLKAMYNYQKVNGDVWVAGNGWTDLDLDSSNYWKVIAEVQPAMLGGFTGLWLEYGQVDAGFISPNSGFSASGIDSFGSYALWDTKYWRVAAYQPWNEKWTTELYYAGYKFDDTPNTWDDGYEWGVGVNYKYNPNVQFGLNFIQAESGVPNVDKDNIVRFRTQVTFSANEKADCFRVISNENGEAPKGAFPFYMEIVEV